MKPSLKVLLLFLVVGVLFIIGSVFNVRSLIVVSTFLLIPALVLYYRYKARKWFLPMVIALALLYIRDLLLLEGFHVYPEPVIWTFGGAIAILYIFALTSFQRATVHPVEIFSLLIMYGFLGFLFYTIAELVPQVMPVYKGATYLYLLVLSLLLAITFTQYLVKSHYASLWLMLASASLLVSEFSLFFKLYILNDVSVKIFHPLFHVLALYSLVQHVLHRRKNPFIPGF